MARKDVQETAEYYHWLIRIERQQFEEKLLDIVSIKNLWKLQQRDILLIMKNKIPTTLILISRVFNEFYLHWMRWPK